MHTTVIIPFHHQGDSKTLLWTLEGFAGQTLATGHTLEVLVGVDGGQGADVSMPATTPSLCRMIVFPRMGSAAVRNALVKESSAELLIFANADTRPDPGMVQCHADTLGRLPPGSLVLGATPWERETIPTVFDTILDETPAVFSYHTMKPGTWHDGRCAYMLNLSMRRDQFLAAGGLPEELRPMYFEDLVLAHRLMGLQPRIYFQPDARVLHRHPMTLDQYLDREEMLGIMAPVLARVAPETFNWLFQANVTANVLAQRYAPWVVMDGPVHRAAYQSLAQWATQPQSRLGDPENRSLILSALYELHVPLKRLAFRLGFLKGMQLSQDAQWQLRRPHGLWREALKAY